VTAAGTDRRRTRTLWAVAWFTGMALLYLVAAFAATVLLSPRVPYADAWQHYATLLSRPFPASVFAADNGHPELFANLVRLASLRWMGGSEVPQIAIGFALALAGVAILAAMLRRPPRLPPVQRAAISCVLVLGVFWLGNGRALLHDNEALHVYSVFACLFAAVALLLRGTLDTPPPTARVTAAAALCAACALNFGSGTAAFVAVAAVLFVRRAARHVWLILAGVLVAVLGLYRMLPGSAGVPLAFHPVAQAGLALHWMASPLVYLLWPLLDPSAASALPAPLAALAGVAHAWTAVAGDVHASVLPQALAGAAFTALLLAFTLRARRDPAALHPVGCAGLALAWFGLGVAGLVALTRYEYFLAHADQIQAPRYLPWSSIAWAGLLVAALGRRTSGRRALAIAALVPLLALAAEGGMAMAMKHQRTVAEDVALAAVVGLLPDRADGGETDADVTWRATQWMRPLGLGPFGWPEAAMVGSRAPASVLPVVVLALSRRPVAGGARIEAHLGDPPCPAGRLLVVEDGRVTGLLRPLGGGVWRGAVRGESGALPADTTIGARCGH
jgi:hypothetical protein